jgi:hypothetical protein
MTQQRDEDQQVDESDSDDKALADKVNEKQEMALRIRELGKAISRIQSAVAEQN